MKNRENKSHKLVKIEESELLTLVASKLKNRTLFPKKIENAKKYLQGARVFAS